MHSMFEANELGVALAIWGVAPLDSSRPQLRMLQGCATAVPVVGCL